MKAYIGAGASLWPFPARDLTNSEYKAALLTALRQRNTAERKSLRLALAELYQDAPDPAPAPAFEPTAEGATETPPVAEPESLDDVTDDENEEITDASSSDRPRP